MSKRIAALVAMTGLVLASALQPVFPQSLDRLKAGVVKITAVAEGKRKTGTGFIVRLDADTAYILTASHVVEGDNQPGIEFFTRQNLTVPGETARIEGGDPRGLALLLVRGKSNLPPGLAALSLASHASPSGGEQVVVIGFPQGAGPWAVVRADVVSRVGRDLTLAGAIDEGNSGGPVLLDGNVVGVVTGADSRFARAAPVAIAALVLEGWGVQPQSVAAPPVASETLTPRVPDAPSGPKQGSVKIRYASCERLRSGTAFRVTLNGDAQGPVGAVVRVALAADGAVKSTPKASCKDWDDCRREAAAPEATRWSMSTIALLPVPTHAVVAVKPNPGDAGQSPYDETRAELDCWRW